MAFSFQKDEILKHFFIALLVATLCACGEKKPEQSPSTAAKTTKLPMATIIARQNLRQDLAGTAYGNFVEMKKALAADSLGKIVRLATETLALLQNYIKHAEEDSLPNLAAAAKPALNDVTQVLEAAQKGETNNLSAALTTSEIHLKSLRELTGMTRTPQ